jgi:hypothetical protein
MSNDTDLEQRIRVRAYELWLEEGKPEGKDKGHWERAQAEIEKLATEPAIGPSPGP